MELFTVKSSYRALNSVDSNGAASPNPIFKALWKANLIHKAQLFLWKYISNILPKKARLSQYAVNNDSNCSMCNVNGSTEHLVLHCQFTKFVWSATPNGYITLQDAGTNPTIKDWIGKLLYNSQDVNT